MPAFRTRVRILNSSSSYCCRSYKKIESHDELTHKQIMLLAYTATDYMLLPAPPGIAKLTLSVTDTTLDGNITIAGLLLRMNMSIHMNVLTVPPIVVVFLMRASVCGGAISLGRGYDSIMYGKVELTRQRPPTTTRRYMSTPT